MKKLLLICSMAAVCTGASAQAIRDAQIQPATQPVYNPFQFTNYYQNNSSYSNNSMQSNAPTPHDANAFPGNGNYVDPTRNAGNVPNQQQGAAPANTPNSNTINTTTNSR